MAETVAAAEAASRRGCTGRPMRSPTWIDAVVELAPTRAGDLRRSFGPELKQATPDVVAGLRPYLPVGPLLTSKALDRAFSEGRFGSNAYLAATSDVVVVVALGE